MEVQTPGRAVSPEAFWGLFSEELRDRVADPDHDWEADFGSDTRWTHRVMDTLAAVGTRLGFEGAKGEVSREYYRVDFGLYRRTGDRPWEWDFAVAVEHENAGETWLDEWVKLLHLRADLKVIITYFDYRKDEQPEDSIERALQIAAQRKHSSPGDRWLLIFCPNWYSKGRGHDIRAFAVRDRELQKLQAPAPPVFPGEWIGSR